MGDMEIAEGLLGKLGRQCYAVLCFGVILLAVTLANYVGAEEQEDPMERTRRRLRAIHGPPFRPSGSLQKA